MSLFLILYTVNNDNFIPEMLTDSYINNEDLSPNQKKT